MRTRAVSGLLLVVSLSLSGCAGPKPVREFTIARTAIDAARDMGAGSSAPGFFHKAEEHYRRGKKLFEENENKGARAQFIRAKQFAEKAENATRLKKFQTGESFP